MKGFTFGVEFEAVIKVEIFPSNERVPEVVEDNLSIN